MAAPVTSLPELSNDEQATVRKYAKSRLNGKRVSITSFTKTVPACKKLGDLENRIDKIVDLILECRQTLKALKGQKSKVKNFPELNSERLHKIDECENQIKELRKILFLN